MEEKFEITEEDLRIAREKANNIESESITIYDTDLGRETTILNNIAKKPIRLRENNYNTFKKIAAAISSIKSKISNTKDQDYSKEFQEAVKQTFDSEEPVVIAADEKEMESWKSFAEDLKKEEYKSEKQPKMEEMVSVAKEDTNGLTDISDIITNSDIDKKVSKERANFDAWIDEQKRNEEDYEDIRVKSAIKPIKNLEFEKNNHTVKTNVEAKNENTLKTSLEEDKINFGSIFNQIQKNSEEIRKGKFSLDTQNSNSIEDETYEQKVQRLTREIEQKKKELAQQQQINVTTQETIERQKNITSKVLTSAEALKSENERIKAENIANLEQVFASAKAECSDALSESYSLEEELKAAKKNQSEATDKMRALQAINDELRKSRSEIESMNSEKSSSKIR